MKNETDEKNKCYINRELSWLKFNDRVLEEAADEENPLCERLSFLSIFQTNLDEFFMVRVGSLHDMQFLKKEVRDNKTGMTPQEQIEAILQTTALMARRKDQVYMDLMGLLTDQGIRVVSFSALNDIEKKQLERYFEQEIKPLLSTIIVGKKQPFPFLQNREIYAVAVLETRSDKAKIGIIPCASRVFDRLVPVPGRSGYYMLAEELILHFLPMVFDKYRVQEKSLIRITRNADIDADSIYDEDLNYREHMEEVVRQRRKLSPVRLEMTRTLDTGIIDRLCRVLELSENQVFMSQSPLDLSFVFQIQDTLRTHSELFYPRRIPQNSPAIQKDRHPDTRRNRNLQCRIHSFLYIIQTARSDQVAQHNLGCRRDRHRINIINIGKNRTISLSYSNQRAKGINNSQTYHLGEIVRKTFDPRRNCQ